MTVTVRQIITKALKDITVPSANVSPTSAEMADGLESFNQLITSREIGDWAQVGDFAISDNFPLPEEVRLYFTAMLASQIAPQYGKDIPAAVADLATRGRNMITGNLMRRGALAIDPGVLGMPSQRFNRGN